MKRTVVRILLISIVLLSACGPNGLASTYVGSTWEEKGNSFCVMDAYFADSYITPDGEEILPYKGDYELLVVECVMDLAEEYQVDKNTAVQKNATGYAAHSLKCDPIPLLENLENGSNYVFLFCMSTEEAETANLQTYRMRLELSNGVNSNIWQEFCLAKMES